MYKPKKPRRPQANRGRTKDPIHRPRLQQLQHLHGTLEILMVKIHAACIPNLVAHHPDPTLRPHLDTLLRQSRHILQTLSDAQDAAEVAIDKAKQPSSPKYVPLKARPYITLGKII
jgi:hypothetical protein